MMRSLRERVVRFGTGGGLAGIVTTPRVPVSEALPCVVIINAGIIHRVGPNRLYVDLARTISLQGFAVLRFDLSGLGDSAPMTGTLSLDESARQDVQQALDYLAESRAAKSFLLVGLCSGANYGLQTAFVDPRVTGVIAIDPAVARTTRSSVLHLARRLKHMATIRALLTLQHPVFQRAFGGRRSMAAARAAAGQSEQRADTTALTPAALAGISTVLNQTLDRGTRLMLVFTGGVNHVYNYQNQLFDLLPDVNFRNLLTLHYMPQTDHTVSDLASRRALMHSVTNWVAQVIGGARHAAEDTAALVASDLPS
jgi:alpha/beta superfamily hydrolase